MNDIYVELVETRTEESDAVHEVGQKGLEPEQESTLVESRNAPINFEEAKQLAATGA